MVKSIAIAFFETAALLAFWASCLFFGSFVL